MPSPMVQEAFAGELSRRMWGRLSSDLYKQGVDVCKNFMITPQRSILLRDGSDDVGMWLAPADRLLPMRMADEQDYLIVLRNNALRLFSLDGQVPLALPVGVTELITNGDFASAGTGWTTHVNAGDVTFESARANLNAVGAVLSQLVTVTTPGQYTLKFTIGGTTYNSTRIYFGKGDWYGDRDNFQFLINQEYLHPGVNTYSVYLTAGVHNILLIRNAVNVWIDDVSIRNVDSGGTPTYSLAAPWTAAQLDQVYIVSEPAADRVFFFHPNKQPRVLQRTGDGVWGFNPLTVVGQPEEWGSDNWPAVGEIQDGRLLAGGAPSHKNRVWVSRAGNFFDFTLTEVVDSKTVTTAACGLDLKFSTKGAIRWALSNRAMMIGTDMDESSLTGSRGGPIAGNDFQAMKHSGFGSSRVIPTVAGSHVLYVSADQRKLRRLEFSLQTNGFDTKDLTYHADHITDKNRLIEEVAFARDPEGIIFAKLSDGTFACCTFDAAEGLAAWWRLELAGPDGATAVVRSAAVSSGPDGTFLWLLVDRPNAGGADTCRLEVMRISEDPDTDPVMVDGRRIIRVIGGEVLLDHIPAGTNVRVVIDGNQLLPNVYTLDADHIITVGEEWDNHMATVGYLATGRAVTLPKNVRGGKTHAPKIGLLLNDSVLPKINGKRPPEMKGSQNVGEGVPRFTGKVEVGSLGWDDKGQIEIIQDIPFRTEILGIFDITQMNDI